VTDDIRETLRAAAREVSDPSPSSLVAAAHDDLPDDIGIDELQAAAEAVLEGEGRETAATEGDSDAGGGGDSDADPEGVTDYTVEEGVFPAELLTLDRWFVWALDNDRKIPRAPWKHPDHIDKYVSYKDADVWTDFETADEWVDKVPRFEHASCIPAYEDNNVERLLFFDFDDCRDPDSGAIHPHAWEFIESHNLAAFLSTSGTGLHAFGWGRLPEGYKPSFEIDLPAWDYADDCHLEVYASARFMALTGQHIEGTPVSVPALGETALEIFRAKGTERTTGTEREPDVSREELADVETTDDIEDIYDAVAHVRPSDIRLRSSVTEEYSARDANCARDPSWANSTSGTRLAEFDDHWLYRKGNIRLDALQVVALEERIIRDESTYPSGQAFVDAVEALRDRGAHIPELETSDQPRIPPSSVDAEGETADSEGAATAETDGGAVADTSASDDSGTDETPDSAESADDDTDPFDDWHEIRSMFREAENADERATPRFEAAMKLNREESFAMLKENEVLYAYDAATGIYEEDGEQIVRNQLTQGLEEQYRAHTKSEVLEHIRGRNTVSKDEMGGPDGLIAARNCVIDLNETTRRDHDPEYRFLSRLGCAFDPDADCPQWRAFLDDALQSDTDRMKLQEFAGYCLMHWDLPFHKALFLVGPTASGKSTFLDTINAMLGEGTVASLTPQQLTSERFGPAELFGKWANIRNDIPKSTVENTGMFKELIAGDPMKAEKKNKDPFFFNPTAKHLFSANQLPEMEVDDEAFFRRVLLVPFPETVPEPERDKHLDDKLEAELAGVLNWAIEGLQRLLGNGGFTADRSPGRTRETWSKWGDSVERFANDAITARSDGDPIPKADLYQAYVEYCRQESMPSDTQHAMTRALKKEGFEDGRTYVDGKQQRCIHGAAWTSRGEQLLEAARSDGSDGDDSRPTGISGFGSGE
jgi:putative DNA primase/helicase